MTWHFLYHSHVRPTSAPLDGSMKTISLWTCFEKLELLSVLTAAFSHDAGHIGKTKTHRHFGFCRYSAFFSLVNILRNFFSSEFSLPMMSNIL